MILKAVAWTWLGIVFVTITGLALWQVVTNLSGAGGFLGFMWIFMVLVGSLALAASVVSKKENIE